MEIAWHRYFLRSFFFYSEVRFKSNEKKTINNDDFRNHFKKIEEYVGLDRI